MTSDAGLMRPDLQDTHEAQDADKHIHAKYLQHCADKTSLIQQTHLMSPAFTMSTILLLLVRKPALAIASSLRDASTDFIS